MKTKQVIINGSSITESIPENSIDLTVTSPPYPMIEMWDNCFIEQDKNIIIAMQNNDYFKAWSLMHNLLDKVWDNVIKATKNGGIICINIGDATRTFNGLFQLFSNRTRITEYFIQNGCVALPEIIWRKRTNAPNKFMGSGMLPPGAYVTLEHESILIFRKGRKREFSKEEVSNRSESAYFYSERNEWFSDLWEIQGVRQVCKSGNRERSAAYPFEIPYRLVNMFSVYNDTVLDPFAGLGTTAMACTALGRNSINVEIDSLLCESIKTRILEEKDWNKIRENRIKMQENFIKLEIEKGKNTYFNEYLGINVKTKQEKNIKLPKILNMSIDNDIEIEYYI